MEEVSLTREILNDESRELCSGWISIPGEEKGGETLVGVLKTAWDGIVGVEGG